MLVRSRKKLQTFRLTNLVNACLLPCENGGRSLGNIFSRGKSGHHRAKPRLKNRNARRKLLRMNSATENIPPERVRVKRRGKSSPPLE